MRKTTGILNAEISIQVHRNTKYQRVMQTSDSSVTKTPRRKSTNLLGINLKEVQQVTREYRQ